MEGKEHYEDDDKRKSESSDNNDYFEDNDSDEFGLPEMEDADHSGNKDSDDTFTSEYSSDSDYGSQSDSDYDESEYTYKEEEEYEEAPAEIRNYSVHGLDDDERKGPGAGLIVFLILLLLLGGGFAAWYFIIRTPPPPPAPVQIIEPVPDTTYEEPEPEPIIRDEPSSTVAGTVTQLSSPTGRYYVIIASFVDDDLAMDYGNKLAKQGTGTILLNPKREKGFYRLAIADYQGLREAALGAEEAKSTYGNDVWVIKY